MNRREFLVGTAAATLATAQSRATPAKQSRAASKPPNVLFVLADQWRFSAFGYAGDPNVHTPHFDKLTAQSMYFAQTFAANPLCTPNRSCIMTSRYSHQQGMTHNDITLPPTEIGMTQVFADAGYTTHYVGKWHMDGEDKPGFVPPGWRRRGVQGFEGFNRGHFYPNPARAQYFTNEGKLLHPELYEPTYETDLALAFMRGHKDKPFFCYLSWGPPHTPYAPPPNWKIYDPEKIQYRDNVPQETRNGPLAKKSLAGYYGLCSSLDAEMSRILKFLDDEGLAENTLLVFTSDHGDMLGSHGAYYKMKPEEESLHVPLTMRLPGRIRAGARTETLTSSIDLMPTILSLCDIKPPATVSGRDLSRIALGAGNPKVESVYAEGQMRFKSVSRNGKVERIESGIESSGVGLPGVTDGKEWRALVTPEHKLIVLYDGTVAALFDRAKDPYEMNNLADKPAYAALRSDLLAKLKKRGVETGDPFPNVSPSAEKSYVV